MILIHFAGLLIAMGGIWIGYHAGFVDSQAVPFAHQLFFEYGYDRWSPFAPYVCFLFYVLIGNALAFLAVVVTGTLFGYKIQAKVVGGLTIGVALTTNKRFVEKPDSQS